MTDTPEAVRLAELLSADPTESPVSLAAAALLRRIPELKSERDQLRAELKTAVAERDQLLSWQQAALQGRMHWLREETKRISNVTLAGNFTNPEDRAYWADRLKKLSGELSVLEHQTKPKRITKV